MVIATGNLGSELQPARASFGLAPVAFFVYDRPEHARRTIAALAQNELARESELFIFSDGARDGSSAHRVAEVRQYLRTITGFRAVHVRERSHNAGLARSIIEGVTWMCREHGRAIVLEDDMVTSRWFLLFMNQGLTLYESDEQVASIHGYCYPVKVELPETFFIRGADCWGWATWARSWRHFEPDGKLLLAKLHERKLTRQFDLGGSYPYTRMLAAQIAGKNDSWAIRWHASSFLNNMFTLYPRRSLVQNIGNDASGTHCQVTDAFEQEPSETAIRVDRIRIETSGVAESAFAEFLQRVNRHNAWQRFVSVSRRLLGIP